MHQLNLFTKANYSVDKVEHERPFSSSTELYSHASDLVRLCLGTAAYEGKNEVNMNFSKAAFSFSH